jgi:hypothetical protein
MPCGVPHIPELKGILAFRPEGEISLDARRKDRHGMAERSFHHVEKNYMKGVDFIDFCDFSARGRTIAVPPWIGFLRR